MSFKVEVLVSKEWSGNALRFATKEEGDLYGYDLLSRWFVPEEYRVVEVDEPVTYVFAEGRAYPLGA